MTVLSFENTTAALTEAESQTYNDSKRENLSALLLRDFYDLGVFSLLREICLSFLRSLARYSKEKGLDCTTVQSSPFLSAKDFFQILFGGGDRPNMIVFNPNVQHVRGEKGRQRGPSKMFLMPRESRVRRMHTAFCSYQESTRERGRSFTLHSNASARARAT